MKVWEEGVQVWTCACRLRLRPACVWRGTMVAYGGHFVLLMHTVSQRHVVKRAMAAAPWRNLWKCLRKIAKEDIVRHLPAAKYVEGVPDEDGVPKEDGAGVPTKYTYPWCRREYWWTLWDTPGWYYVLVTAWRYVQKMCHYARIGISHDLWQSNYVSTRMRIQRLQARDGEVSQGKAYL